MLIKSIDYTENTDVLKYLGDSVFRYCKFTGFSVDGNSINSIFLLCEFKELDWYWTSFYDCLFVDVLIENCTFSGVHFENCRFLNSKFINCKFEENNLGSPCEFIETQFISTALTGCVGLPDYLDRIG